MSDGVDEELPPLGEPTPSRPGSAPRRSRRQVTLAAGLALLAGLAAGFGLATAVDDDGAREPARPPGGNIGSNTTAPPTRVETLPPECVATVRSAQQTLALLDQGLRDLRNLNLGEADRAAREVQQLRESFEADARRCLELMGD